MSFQGKVVIVTGASSGIGAAIAVKFAEDGARVCLVGRNHEKLNTVAKRCEDSLVLIADVSKDEDAIRIINDTVKYFGQIDILINNAGIGLRCSITQENAMDTFDRVMATNFRAPVYITSLAVPHLVKTKGNIVNISSVTALRVLSKDTFACSASKAGLDHFTRLIALDLASSGIRVNTVNPGPVKTDIIENAGASQVQAESTFESWKKRTALGRVSIPEEVADVVLFLASNNAKAITGSTYVTDNGMLLKGND